MNSYMKKQKQVLTSIQIRLLECMCSFDVLHLLGTHNEIVLLNSRDSTMQRAFHFTSEMGKSEKF